MSVYLLPVDATTDNARLTELLHAVSAKPIAADWLRSSMLETAEDQIRWRVVAVAECGAIVGYGETGRHSRMEPGRFWVQVVVDPAYRNQGIGTMLYDDVARFAWEMGATHLASDIYGDECDSLCFARKRGFVIETSVAGRMRVRLNVASGVPASPREAVKARYREYSFELLTLEALEAYS